MTPAAESLSRGVAALAVRVGRSALDLFLPRLCLACDATMPPVPRRLCDACLEEIEGRSFEGVKLCRRCGEPSDGFRGVCVDCRIRPPAFSAARAFGPWEGALRDAVLRMKFAPEPALAKPLGLLVAHAAERLPVRADLVVPVPIPDARLRRRGFNQAAMLARVAAARLGLPFSTRTLARRLDAERQTRASRARRAANLRDAISAVDPRAGAATVDGRVVLLVDDVLTTGATAGACARALRAAGAKAVLVATVARATRGALSVPRAADVTIAAP